MQLSQQYQPTSLAEVIGQPIIVGRLRTFLAEPFPCWMAFVGPTGVGKTTCMRILAESVADPWFGVHRISGASLDLSAVEHYFGSDSPFRFRTPANHLHVLTIEELEVVPDKTRIALKDAWDVCRERNWRVVVLATSNDMSRLEPALRDRFGEPFVFDGGAQFAKAFCQWMRTVVWPLESEGPIPADHMLWGLDLERGTFSARRAMDACQAELLKRKAQVVA
jgi:hypothetical protein